MANENALLVYSIGPTEVQFHFAYRKGVVGRRRFEGSHTFRDISTQDLINGKFSIRAHAAAFLYIFKLLF